MYKIESDEVANQNRNQSSLFMVNKYCYNADNLTNVVLHMIFPDDCRLPDGRVIPRGTEFEYRLKGSPVRCLCEKEHNAHGKLKVNCRRL